MNRFSCFASMLVAVASCQAAMPELPLMPMPAHVERHEGALTIDNDFHVGLCGTGNAAFTRTLSRFTDRIVAETGLVLITPVMSDCTHATLTIQTQRFIAMPALGDDDSYKLEITPKSAQLTAATSTGVLRGLATFQQLIASAQSGFAVPAVSIDDHARFSWRGLSLDVARHWIPLEVVERNLDAMAAVKLNVFHWHLSDDQGFRVESKVFPKLQGEGSDGHFYTQEQIRHTVAYAAERGIRVIPEFDIPGHATSWLVGYPELASAPGPYQIERKWGIFEPVIDPTRESTYRFLDRFFAEMAPLFPDPYFHIGGDEVLETQWKASPAIQQFMQANGFVSSKQLHAHFNRRVNALLMKRGKKIVGWDEILNPDMPPGTVIQSWRGQESLAAAARGGSRGLLSFGYYLDHMSPASFHYANDPLSGDAKNLTPEQSSRILGGEAAMWTEYANGETVDSRLWPRLAAIAERLWSPAEQTDVISMYARLAPVSQKLQWTGIKHLAAQKPMLDRIAGDRVGFVLSDLANSVEATGIDDRASARRYTSLIPLNRLVDASVAESELVRSLISDVHAVLAAPGVDQSAEHRLRIAFATWRNMPGSLAPLAGGSELAAETVPVAETLAALGATGDKALDCVVTHQPPPAGWVDSQKPLLESASKITAEVRVAGAEVVRALLEALGNSTANAPVVSGSASR